MDFLSGFNGFPLRIVPENCSRSNSEFILTRRPTRVTGNSAMWRRIQQEETPSTSAASFTLSKGLESNWFDVADENS
jgi:hypothetical protein